VPRGHQLYREVWSCKRDEGRSLGVGDQAQAPNHCELPALRALVVSVAGKAGGKSCQVRSGETSASEPLITAEIYRTMSKPGGRWWPSRR